MKLILKFLITVIVLLGINTTQIFAEDDITPELQSFDQKIAEIEAQIDGLEKKGLEHLTDEEFVKYSELSDKLIKTQREKTAEQKKIIADEKKKQQAYESINEALKSIQGTLSSSYIEQ